jgi:hypothetical protein
VGIGVRDSGIGRSSWREFVSRLPKLTIPFEIQNCAVTDLNGYLFVIGESILKIGVTDGLNRTVSNKRPEQLHLRAGMLMFQFVGR